MGFRCLLHYGAYPSAGCLHVVSQCFGSGQAAEVTVSKALAGGLTLRVLVWDLLKCNASTFFSRPGARNFPYISDTLLGAALANQNHCDEIWLSRAPFQQPTTFNSFSTQAVVSMTAVWWKWHFITFHHVLLHSLQTRGSPLPSTCFLASAASPGVLSSSHLFTPCDVIPTPNPVQASPVPSSLLGIHLLWPWEVGGVEKHHEVFHYIENTAVNTHWWRVFSCEYPM